MPAPIQFAHANGFPSETYLSLFDQLAYDKLNYISKMGLKLPVENVNFETLAQEAIASIEANFTQPVVGLGHSSGAMCLIVAASQRPDLFERVIAIEPPLFGLFKRSAIGLFRTFGQGDRLGPTQKALKRRTLWSSKEEAKAYFSQKRLFQGFDERSFEAYLKHGLVPEGDQLGLAIPAPLEVAIFRSVLTRAPKGMHKLPITLIHADQSDMFWKWDVSWWKRSFPNFEYIAYPGGHLFPLDEPDKTAKLLNSLLS